MTTLNKIAKAAAYAANEPKDFLKEYPEFFVRNPDEWRTGEQVAEGYETWVEFLILSHYGAHCDESNIERGNARWLVEEFLPQYPQEVWEVSGGGMYTTYVAIDTQSACWEDLFEHLIDYSGYPQLGDSDQLWYEEEHNQLVDDCWYWLQALDLPEGYEWVKEFTYQKYVEIPSLFGAMRLDEEQEDYSAVDEVFYVMDTVSNGLETGFQYHPSYYIDDEVMAAAIAKLLELGRIQQVVVE